MKAKVIFVMIVTMLVSSCSAWFGESEGEDRATSSLVKYLYSDGNYAAHEPEVPTLRLPVRVGVAFVPLTYSGRASLHKKDEIVLLDKVKSSFVKYEYIDRIEVIPSTYLENGDGFTTLEQVARLYDVDIMALVSYDQVSRSSHNPASLLYWTIVGAYIIPGNKNVTQTFVDTAVFDVSTHKLLFRAPGIDKTNSYATAVGATNDARVKSVKGFENAVVNMTANLDLELSRFKVRVKEEKIAKVKIRNGYSSASYYGGGGSSGLVMLIMLGMILVARLSRSAALTEK